MRWKIWLVACCLSSAIAQDENADTSVAENKQVAEIIRTFGGRGAMKDGSLPTPPEKAVTEFRMRDGFAIELLVGDDRVGQPLSASWDSKGRLWVMQYLQYQFPAGLKIIEYDNHLRAQFDKVPEPPPHGTPGADKVTVFEDTNGDGKLDRSTDVITGLNIATSAVTGHGGVWVANPPYLLFYPLVDDLKVGEPEVKLSGFGIEDTHAVMNSLKWGPDGWLYGANGSTTTGNVNGIKWQGQMIWRYHPDTEDFEIYAEGGGNTFSVEIDSKGRVFSGTNHGKTRGMFYPQGSYGTKNWGKHGPLTNPYAFGYFEHMQHEGDDRRFAQAFAINEHGLFDEKYDQAIIAPNSLQNVVWISEMHRQTSTWRTVDQENLVETDDRWFRPVWAGMGPDGACYMADWSDSRLSHVRPVDDWDKDTGRIYRIQPAGVKIKSPKLDLAHSPVSDLIANFENPNRWIRQRSVLELGWRGDDTVLPQLKELVGNDSLEALWAVNLLGGLTDKVAIEWLSAQDPHLRRWIVRIVGDRKSVSGDLADVLSELAARESDVEVRSQLASSAKRLPAEVAIPIIQNLIGRSEDLTDLHLPLLDWWALEAHADDHEYVLRMIDEQTWKMPIFREQVAGRLMRRWAMAGGDANFAAAATFLESAPDEDAEKILVTGLLEAFEGTSLPKLPPALTQALAASATEDELVLRLKQGDKKAVAEAGKIVASSGSPLARRLTLAKLLGQSGDPTSIAPLTKVLAQSGQSPLKRVALQALANFDDPAIAKSILQRYGSSLPAEHDVRSTANRVLASRVVWAKELLAYVDRWIVKARDIGPDVVLQLRQHADPEIDAIVDKHWPQVRAEAVAEIARVRSVLTETGDLDKGQEIYTQRCAICHKLFEEGGAIGPDLTGYERGNLDFWLPSIISPSLELREGYIGYVAAMKDGRVMLGMIADQDSKTVTLRDIAGQTTKLSRSELKSLEASKISLMPEGLLGGLDDAALRDLFTWLTHNSDSGSAK